MSVRILSKTVANVRTSSSLLQGTLRLGGCETAQGHNFLSTFRRSYDVQTFGVCNRMRGSLCRQWIRAPSPEGLGYGAITLLSRDFVSSTRGRVSARPSMVLTRGLNIFSVFNKEAREKEKERLRDELNRGYFDDFREMKKSGGKMALASTNLTPILASPRFPPLEVHVPRGGPALTLPVENSNVTLICMAFRASAQPMVVSWSSPFAHDFNGSPLVSVFEVSVVESSVLSLWPIKRLLLRIMQGSQGEGNALERKVVYSFGDTYDFRKALGVPNLLSGYAFLLDRKGRVRWRASGMATNEELQSMASCTTRLLREEASKST